MVSVAAKVFEKYNTQDIGKVTWVQYACKSCELLQEVPHSVFI